MCGGVFARYFCLCLRVCRGPRVQFRCARGARERRFTFELDPSSVPLKLDSPVMLGPKDGFLVLPIPRRS